jgi:hypothetical protein
MNLPCTYQYGFQSAGKRCSLLILIFTPVFFIPLMVHHSTEPGVLIINALCGFLLVIMAWGLQQPRYFVRLDEDAITVPDTFKESGISVPYSEIEIAWEADHGAQRGFYLAMHLKTRDREFTLHRWRMPNHESYNEVRDFVMSRVSAEVNNRFSADESLHHLDLSERLQKLRA